VPDIEIKGSVADIARLFGRAVAEETKVQATKLGREVVKSTAKRALTAWQKFLKEFKFRKRKRTESPSAYLSARSKAASRAWKRTKKGKGTKKGMRRKTARRAYE
jgi:hypothetical protein